MTLRDPGLKTVWRRFGLQLLVLLPGLWNNSLIAAPQAPSQAPPAGARSKSVDISFHQEMMTLNATHASWSEVLDEFGRATGIRFHYARAPQGVVTVSCPSMTVMRAIACILGGDTGLILRYPPQSDAPKKGTLPTDVWLLGEPGTGREGSAVAVKPQKAEPQQVKSQGAAAERFTALMDMTQSEDAGARMQALGSLAASGKRNDPAVQETFRVALVDDDASVRAQGVYALAKEGGLEAMDVLRKALKDSDASVRLMAVDTVEADAQGTALLQEALADSDETVRMLAAMKLRQAEDTVESLR